MTSGTPDRWRSSTGSRHSESPPVGRGLGHSEPVARGILRRYTPWPPGSRRATGGRLVAIGDVLLCRPSPRHPGPDGD